MTKIHPPLAGIAVFMLLSLCLTGCGIGDIFRRPPKPVPNAEWMELEVRRRISSMSVEQKASQVLMTGIDGREYSPSYLRKRFGGTVPGAILLFRYNIPASPASLWSFLHDSASELELMGEGISPLFAIDHEGGDVYRTGRLTTRLPSADWVARNMKPDEAALLYEYAGRQLAALGVGMNLAPVAEPLTELNSAFLGTRSYSASPEMTAVFARSALQGYRRAGVFSVLKHFPGNGAADPHAALSRIDLSLAELEKGPCAPFRALIAEKPDAMLVSHVIVSCIDPDLPFCLSEKGINGFLRGSLGFSGLVITDDLSMAALTASGIPTGEAAIRALRAGCDLLMTSAPDIRSLVQAISAEAGTDSAFAARLDEAVCRILELKTRQGLVKTGQERYSESRYRTASVSGGASFPREHYREARRLGDSLLEAFE